MIVGTAERLDSQVRVVSAKHVLKLNKQTKGNDMAILLELTLEQKKQRQKAKIQGLINSHFQTIQQGFSQVFASVWANPELTPQEVMDAFGSDAVALFQFANAFQNVMNTLQPGVLIQAPPKAFTINQDGTVTITE